MDEGGRRKIIGAAETRSAVDLDFEAQVFENLKSHSPAVGDAVMAERIPVQDLRKPIETVEQYMTKDPLCFTRDTTLEEAVEVRSTRTWSRRRGLYPLVKLNLKVFRVAYMLDD